MQSLTKDDLQFCVRRLPADVRDQVVKHQIMMAGGYIRSRILGELPNDIDLFSSTKDHAKLCAQSLAQGRKAKLIETDNAFTVAKHGTIPVQYIHRWNFSNPEHCVESFDFTIAQAAIWCQGLEGGKPCFRSLCSDRFYADLAAKRLVYTCPVREEEAGGSMLRVCKFLRRGFNISPESLGKVMARMAVKIEYGHHDAPHVSNVLTGLLREVDPLLVDHELG